MNPKPTRASKTATAAVPWVGERGNEARSGGAEPAGGERSPGDAPPPIRVLSLGAGVQSTTLALMAAKGEIEAPDCAIFADTGDEKRGTYRYLAWLESQLPFPVHRVSRSGNMSLSESTTLHYRADGGFDQTPPFYYPGGMLPKHCSKEWKTRVIIQAIRRMFDTAPGQRVPSTASCEVLLGISVDEAHRMKPSEARWITNKWPLIDKRMRRSDCIIWLERAGYPLPPRSACVYCPYQSDAEFAGMKETPADDDWQRAVEFDHAIRNGGNGTSGPLYVSRYCKPLDIVELGSQPDLFGEECEGMCGV